MKVYGMYEDAKNYYIVSELISGEELFEHFKLKKRLPEAEAFVIFRQVLLALNHLHINGLMHR
jgi:calcium-dependent protein kinase